MIYVAETQAGGAGALVSYGRKARFKMQRESLVTIKCQHLLTWVWVGLEVGRGGLWTSYKDKNVFCFGGDLRE